MADVVRWRRRGGRTAAVAAAACTHVLALALLVALTTLSSARVAALTDAEAIKQAEGPKQYDGEYTYDGCYIDKPFVQLRALPMAIFIDNKLTHAKCFNMCGARGFAYAGLEYVSECWCSQDPPKYEKVADAKCSSVCSGEKSCGGPLFLSVYTNHAVKEPDVGDRPLLCLAMILKNEAHTIKNTLDNLTDHIDCWYILDTGSTDGTQAKVKELMKTVPGKVFEEPFIDYGASRNRIFEITEQQSNPTFTLMLSADERVLNPKHMREFCRKYRFAAGVQHGAYPVMEEAGIKFEPVRIKRTDDNWRYKGRVHEYMGPPGDFFPELWRPKPTVDVHFQPTDDDRRMDSQFLIERILTEEHEKDPYDLRSCVYLARTESLLKNHTTSYGLYRHLVEYTKDPEERYHGWVMQHEEGKQFTRRVPVKPAVPAGPNGVPAAVPASTETKLVSAPLEWHFAQQHLMRAYNLLPGKRDAPHQIAQHYYNAEQYALAYVWSSIVIKIPRPENLDAITHVLLRQTYYLYEYEGERLHGFIAHRLGLYEECVLFLSWVVKARGGRDDYAQNALKECAKKAKGGRGMAIPSPSQVPSSTAALKKMVTRPSAECPVCPAAPLWTCPALMCKEKPWVQSDIECPPLLKCHHCPAVRRVPVERVCPPCPACEPKAAAATPPPTPACPPCIHTTPAAAASTDVATAVAAETARLTALHATQVTDAVARARSEERQRAAGELAAERRQWQQERERLSSSSTTSSASADADALSPEEVSNARVALRTTTLTVMFGASLIGVLVLLCHWFGVGRASAVVARASAGLSAHGGAMGLRGRTKYLD